MNQIRRICPRLINNIRCYSDLYEPTYLDALKPPIPILENINVQMKGYDYAVIENYQKFIHNLVTSMDIEVEDAWGLPPQHMQVTTYKPNSEIINSEYKLKAYKRTVQLAEISSVQLPLLLRALEASTPAGVNIHLEVHNETHDEERFIPDKELLTLKQELDDLGGSRKK